MSTPVASETTYRSWRDLPFSEIWCFDFEFYPGRGLSSGGREGDLVTPLCLVALEMRSGRTVRVWQDEFGPFPPFRFDDGAVFFSHMLTAEYSCHIRLGWGQPARAICTYVEFRHFVNDGSAKAEDRPKGFHSLDGALRYFCDDGIDVTHKKDMRDKIVAGPPFNTDERVEILEYCETDVRALARLVEHVVPTIRSFPHALGRAKYLWAVAQQEHRGVPIDLQFLERYRLNEDALKRELAIELDTSFGVYEFDKDGKPHWRNHLFVEHLKREQMLWPTLPSGALDTEDATFREMERRYPQIGPLRELRYTLSKLKLNNLAVGCDGRNRAILGPYGSKTARNQPSNAKFVFGPAKWLRFLIAPQPGKALVHRDFQQQEPRVAAFLSGDKALQEACSQDVYLGIATALGFDPTPTTRDMFKTVVLGLIYGLGAHTLASRIGVSLYEAAEILARLRARFRVFEDFASSVLDHAGLDLEVGTQFGWVMQCPPGINPRTVRNFPIQSTGAEILHVACILAERRGIKIVAPVHDALMAECDLDCVEDTSAALDRVMRDAAAIVVPGLELPTDIQIIRPGGRYYDKRGATMWSTVERLLTKLETKTA